MRSTRLAPLFAFALVSAAPGVLGCGMLMPKGGAGGAGSPGVAGSYDSPQDVKDTIRSGEARGDQISDPVEDQEVAKQEKAVLHALAMSLGTEGPSPGMPPYESASQSLGELRAAKFKLRIEPVTGASGAAVGGGSFVQLKDSFTDRVQALQGKLASGTASASERAEVMNGSKQIMKLTGLRMQVTAVSQAALMTNSHVINGGLTTMLKIAGMVAARKQHNMDFTDDDYARVKRILARQKHWDAMGAATMGMLAAYEAIIGTTTGDPKALDAIANSTAKAFPLDPQVSDDDAKAYVSHLTDNVGSMKSKYETMMRQNLGDAVYEAQYKAGIDALFARAAGAANTKSVTQVAGETRDKYSADLAKCARGEPIDPGSMVGPAKCKAARSQALSGGGAGGDGTGGDGSDGSGGAGVPLPNGVQGTVNGVENGINKVQQGVGVANAVANGDAAGAIQGAADMFPGDGPIQSSLQGVAALTKGDFKGALKSAVGLASLIPGGSLIKEGLGLAGKLLGIFG
jgi:hypothetical protein